MDSIKDKLIPAIDDSRVLVHVFILIFFFEDFLIITKQTSLLHTSISFDSISLQPFIIFFVVLTASRILWWYIHLTIYSIQSAFNWSGTGYENKRDSYTAFLLFILSSVYSWQFLTKESIRPVTWVEHPYLFAFICLALIATIIFSFRIGIWYGTDFSDSDEKK
jgi:hypothetical protein